MTRAGVTGHRNLPNPVDLRRLAADAIERYPDPTILSSLAEGADRLVARLVLEQGGQLQVVLPLTIDDYLEDFATEDSRREFRELLARCPEPIYLRTRRIAEETSDPHEQAELRTAAYEAAGRYVVDHCDLLLALWDGQPARGRGGTAEIVTYALGKGRPVLRIWDGKCVML